jgi:hypothetical protein
MRNFEVLQFRLPEFSRFEFPTTTAYEEDTIVRFIEIGRRGKFGLP